MQTTLTVKIERVYGEDKIYPVCQTSHLICDLLEQKTLTQRNITRLKEIGFSIEVKPNQPTHL
jgi:hypothetical protein